MFPNNTRQSGSSAQMSVVFNISELSVMIFIVHKCGHLPIAVCINYIITISQRTRIMQFVLNCIRMVTEFTEYFTAPPRIIFTSRHCWGPMLTVTLALNTFASCLYKRRLGQKNRKDLRFATMLWLVFTFTQIKLDCHS